MTNTLRFRLALVVLAIALGVALGACAHDPTAPRAPADTTCAKGRTDCGPSIVVGPDTLRHP